MKRKSGIYKISIDKYFYYGQSVNLDKRMKEHLNALKGNRHSNAYMQNVWDKHLGEFTFEIVELCSEDKLDDREQIYLDKFIDDPLCMNIMPCARNTRHSQETREKISRAKTGKALGQKHREKIAEARRKPVEIILPDGTTKKYDSVSEAAASLGVPRYAFNRWIAGGSP